MKATLALKIGVPVGVASLALGHAAGCKAAPAADPVDAGAVDATAREPRSPTSDGSDPTAPDLDGWEHFSGFLPSCGFYLPKAAAALPAPLKWEPCPDNPNTPGRICRKVATDWEGGIKDDMNGFRRSNGAVLLMTTRVIDGDLVHLISEPDGPIESAVRVRTPSCGLLAERGDGDYYSYFAGGSDNGQAYVAALAGKLGDRPRIVDKHIDGALSSEYAAGPLGVVANASLAGATLLRWDDPAPIPIPLPSDTGNLQNALYRFVGGPLFWPSSAGLRYYRTVYYTPETGSRILLTNGESTTTGVADLGTDGTDMVWLEGEGRVKDELGFAKFTIVTSPFTLDPLALQPRRIQTDLKGVGLDSEPFVVGCGRAARLSSRVIGGQEETRILVVRLADGAQWWIDAENMFPLRPLGMTCDEIFVHAVMPPPSSLRTVARIRLDSLGSPLVLPPR